jgi:hypothetical protein
MADSFHTRNAQLVLSLSARRYTVYTFNKTPLNTTKKETFSPHYRTLSNPEEKPVITEMNWQLRDSIKGYEKKK